MKNLYLYIIVCLSMTSAFAQDLQNAVWHFGNGAGLNFNTIPPIPTPLPTSVGFNTSEGCASVSDENGNLLLISDGVKVWKYSPLTLSYEVLTSSLKGNSSSFQNVIIVPRPLHLNHYYIVTIDGWSGAAAGLHYTEIDLTDTINPVKNLNTAFADNSGTIIDEFYGNSSEGLTSVKHADGFQYWIVTHIKDWNNSQLNSYLVTPDGIILNPLKSLNFSVDYVFGIKISPNMQRIAISSESGIHLGIFNNITGESNISTAPIGNSGPTGALGLEFSPNSKLLYYTRGVGDIYRINIADENSPSGETNMQTSGALGLQLGIDKKIYITNPVTPYLSVISNPDSYSSPNLSFRSIHLNRNAVWGLPQLVDINFCNEEEVTGITKVDSTCSLIWNDTAATYLIEVVGDSNCNHPLDSVGDGQNTSIYGTITTNDNYIYITDLVSLAGRKEFRFRIKTTCGTWSDWCCFDAQNCNRPYPGIYPNGSCFYGEQPCNADLNLNITETVLMNTIVEEQASNTINAVNIISAGADADYHAGNAVFLNPGFIAQSGSFFIAHIEECTDGEARTAQERGKEEKNIVKSQESFISNEVKKEYVIISPNPSSVSVEISLENLKMNGITVTSMDGRVMFDKKVSDVASYKLDISNYNVGIYMITARTTTGKVITGKIIKN